MIKIGRYQLCFFDLLVDSAGKLSASKIWFHVANIIMSKVMLTQQNVSWELLAAYGAVCGGSHIASLWLKSKYGVSNAAINDGDALPEK